ncbi:hypothetical protein QL285_028170 [Trifolium repens]|nr:hypothetical protein QL285_028170 [Trifolium repens]
MKSSSISLFDNSIQSFFVISFIAFVLDLSFQGYPSTDTAVDDASSCFSFAFSFFLNTLLRMIFTSIPRSRMSFFLIAPIP